MALPGPPQRQPLSPSPVRKKTAQERTSAMKKEEKKSKSRSRSPLRRQVQFAEPVSKSCPRWSRGFQSGNANEGCQRGGSPQGWGVTSAVEEPDLQLQASGGGEEGRGKGGPADQKVMSPPHGVGLGGCGPCDGRV